MRRVPGLLSLLALAPLLLAGCAALNPRSSHSGALVRPDSPPEYDVLVAQQMEKEGRQAEAIAAYQRAVAKDDGSAYLHRKLAESLAQSSRIDDALYHANRAHEIDPGDVPTRVFLGQLYRLRRDADAAEKVLVDESGEPIDGSAAFLLYQLYLETLQPERALEIAEWWVEYEPVSVRARVALANAYQRLNRPLDAEAALRGAIEENPGNLRLYNALARSFKKRGNAAGEIALYRELLEQMPGHHATLVALADAQLTSGDVDGAIATFEVVEQRYPDDLRTSARLGYLLYRARRYGEAQTRFERILAANPEGYEMYLFLGLSRRGIGDVAGAIEAFSAVPTDADYYAEARTQIATVYERRGDYARALREVERALASEFSRSLEIYALTMSAKAGDFDGSVNRLEEMIEESPDDDELLYSLGVIYGEAKRTDEAIALMQRALEKNPDNAAALNYIGYTWAENGTNLDDAEALIVRALELQPEDGYIADSLGWLYYVRARSLVESGRRGEAQPLIDRALRELYRADELTGGDPVVSEHLGDTYLLLDDKRRALEKFEEALRLLPRKSEQPDLPAKLESLRLELR